MLAVGVRRLVVLVAGLLLLCGCAGLADAGKDDDGPRPTARSEVDGVEVWDLTAPPSAEAFGVREDRNAGIFETQEPRTIRFKFPGGSDLTVEATLVSFYRSGTGEDAIGSDTVRLGDLLVGAQADSVGADSRRWTGHHRRVLAA